MKYRREMFFRNSAISMNFRKTLAAELSPPEDISDTSRLPKAVINTVLTVSFHLSVVKFRSVPEERLLKQAEYMASQGVKELILVAQETTVYGTDLYGKKTLHLLLKKLCQIRGIRWIRVLYCYPEEIYDELIQVMKEEPKICHYLDLPIQHASDKILRRMGRRTSNSS